MPSGPALPSVGPEATALCSDADLSDMESSLCWGQHMCAASAITSPSWLLVGPAPSPKRAHTSKSSDTSVTSTFARNLYLHANMHACYLQGGQVTAPL